MDIFKILNILNGTPAWYQVCVWITFVSATFLIIIRCTILSGTQTKEELAARRENITLSQTINGDKGIQLGTTGESSPINVGPIYFGSKESRQIELRDLVDPETITRFFKKFEISLANRRREEKNKLEFLPTFLKVPYNIRVTVSSIHGMGYEFLTPSSTPRIDIIPIDLPIEEYFFSKFSDATISVNVGVISINQGQSVFIDGKFTAGKNIMAISQEADVLLVDSLFRYSEQDAFKKIDFVRIFGNNQKSYWAIYDPDKEVDFLFNTFRRRNEALKGLTLPK
jgi:hypothetical protein